MIQAAHVGIGIQGREGLQASLASDYSILEFRHLRPLLFVHGRSSYHRLAYVTLFSMYKSVILAFSQGIYAFFTGFSGINFYDSMQLTLYNIVYTGLPIFFFLFDRDVDRETAMNTPRLYRPAARGELFNWKKFFLWELRGMVQGVILQLINFAFFQYTSIPTNQVAFTSYMAVLTTHTLTLFGDSHTLTWVNHLFLWGCYLIVLPITAVVSAISTSQSGIGVFTGSFSLPLFYIVILVDVVVLLTPIWIYDIITERRMLNNPYHTYPSK